MKGATLFGVALGCFAAQGQYYAVCGYCGLLAAVPLGGTQWRTGSMEMRTPLEPGQLVHVRSQLGRVQLAEKYGGMEGGVFDARGERVLGLRARLPSRETIRCWLRYSQPH